MTVTDFLWLVLFAILAAASVQASRLLYKTWLSPLSIFVGVIGTSVACYHLRLIDMNDVSNETHLVILAGLVAFTGGVLLGSDGRRVDTGDARPGPGFSAGLGPFFYLTGFIATVGWLVAAIILVGRFGLLGLLNNVWVLQESFQMQFIGYFNMVGILVLPTFVIRVASGTRRFWDPVLAASAVLGLLLAGIKSYLVYSSLTALLAWAALHPRSFKTRYLVGGLGVLLAFFVVYTNKVDIFSTDMFITRGPLRYFPALSRPWLYLVGPWPAMDNVVTGVAPDLPRWGAVTFQPLWKLLGDGLGLIESIPLPLPFTAIGSGGFNVYSFFGEVFWDWGFAGVLVYSTALGLIATRLYLQARRAYFWGHTLLYSLVSYGLFLACFMYTYRFNMLVMLLYLFALGFFVFRGMIFYREIPDE